MHVISLKRLREFSSTHSDAESSLMAWYRTVKRVNWQSLAELKEVYPTADLVGRRTVFNIGGNKYRLITRIVYRSQTVFVIEVLTHKEYDLGNGRNEKRGPKN